MHDAEIAIKQRTNHAFGLISVHSGYRAGTL
jgi:hypothetical protein